jgi:phosphate transport system permease protein
MSARTMQAGPAFRPRLSRRRLWGALFAGACVVFALAAVAVLVVLLLRVLAEGWSRLDANLLTNSPSLVRLETAGVRPALWGTIWLAVITAAVSVPIGVGAAIYLHEYARDNWLTRVVQLNIANLAGVPSIVYGILGLAVFINALRLGNSLLAGGLTLSLLSMPVIIIAAREALAAVPDSLRQASYALGATRWQTIRHHVLPAGLPGILTGVILALSRAVGEAAPLVMIGAFARIDSVPGENFAEYGMGLGGLWSWLRDALLSSFAALPIQVYNFSDSADADVRVLAAATIVVLLAILLTMNALAVGIRAWQQRSRLW